MGIVTGLYIIFGQTVSIWDRLIQFKVELTLIFLDDFFVLVFKLLPARLDLFWCFYLNVVKFQFICDHYLNIRLKYFAAIVENNFTNSEAVLFSKFRLYKAKVGSFIREKVLTILLSFSHT